MNRLWCSLLSQTLRRCRATAAPQRLLQWCSSGPRPIAALLRRPRQFRWYHDPWKATAATAMGLSAAVLALCCEVVPCTNRYHLVVYSHKGERDHGESLFASELKSIHRHWMVDPDHPDSVRVRLIAGRIIHAANRGLGIYDSRDAPLLRVTRKKKPWAPQPHTSHLHGLDGFELALVRHTSPNAGSASGGKILLLVFTGLLDLFKTDGEIAFILAHEVGHLIARHPSDIGNSVWLPDFLRRIFLQRMEIEADHIGILLLAAAGFHPDHALAVAKKLATIAGDYSIWKQVLDTTHPHPKDRLACLSKAKTMEEALELYREANARDKVTEKYFSRKPGMSVSDENGISNFEK